MLAVVGNLSRDRVGGRAPRVGGGPFHAARALRAAGRRALIVAGCAPDDRRELLEPLVALGLPLVWRPAAATAAFSFEYDADGVRDMHVDALGDAWPPDPLPAEVRAVHVSPLSRADFSGETLAVLARGRTLSYDGQGLVRPARTGALELDADFDRNVLRHVSVLKLAEDEAAVLVDGLDERALGSFGVREVVVTLGARGCVVYADGIAEHVPARAVTARDPTGAGDAFAAMYLSTRSIGTAPVAAARVAASTVAVLLR